MVTAALAGWEPGRHVAAGFDRPTFRRGTGPGVVVIHESPGLTPEVVAFADEVVAAGFTVVLPHLFGPAGTPPRPWDPPLVWARLCVTRELSFLATGRTTPLAGWLRDLARTLHAELGGPGVGALGMCLTGGFALAMAVDPSVAAPVVAQPALPLPLGRRRAADLGLDAARPRGRDSPHAWWLPGPRGPLCRRLGDRDPLRHPPGAARCRLRRRRAAGGGPRDPDRRPQRGGRGPGGPLPHRALFSEVEMTDAAISPRRGWTEP